MEDETTGSRVALSAPPRKKTDWKRKYLTLRGWTVVLAAVVAAVMFGVATSRIIFK